MSAQLAAIDSYPQRLARLWAELDALPSLAIAFSGGVDSTVLLHAARARLGERALGVIADSASLPRQELAQALAASQRMGVELLVLATDELSNPRYQENGVDRCYFCKHALFEAMGRVCRERNIAHAAFGEIADDLALLRHGARAAREFGVVAPLSAAGFTKSDVRRYAREHGLECADKPASACLSSRLPTGTAVTRERLARIENCEAALRELGLRVLRVRDHTLFARVEVGQDEFQFASLASDAIARRLAAWGFARFELAVYRAPAPAPQR